MLSIGILVSYERVNAETLTPMVLTRGNPERCRRMLCLPNNHLVEQIYIMSVPVSKCLVLFLYPLLRIKCQKREITTIFNGKISKYHNEIDFVNGKAYNEDGGG